MRFQRDLTCWIKVGRGVLTTASYEARKYGVRSGMASESKNQNSILSQPEFTLVAFVAQKLCPELIILSNHFHLYSEMSSRVMAIFRRYDDTMCPAGSDEAYLKYVVFLVHEFRSNRLSQVLQDTAQSTV